MDLLSLSRLRRLRRKWELPDFSARRKWFSPPRRDRRKWLPSPLFKDRKKWELSAGPRRLRRKWEFCVGLRRLRKKCDCPRLAHSWSWTMELRRAKSSSVNPNSEEDLKGRRKWEPVERTSRSYSSLKASSPLLSISDRRGRRKCSEMDWKQLWLDDGLRFQLLINEYEEKLVGLEIIGELFANFCADFPFFYSHAWMPLSQYNWDVTSLFICS